MKNISCLFGGRVYVSFCKLGIPQEISNLQYAVTVLALKANLDVYCLINLPVMRSVSCTTNLPPCWLGWWLVARSTAIGHSTSSVSVEEETVLPRVFPTPIRLSFHP